MAYSESRVTVIAHRGASGHVTEHTVEAYDLAIAMGADVLELDVRLTADGEPVVVHDTTLQRTLGDPRAIDEITHADLFALDGAGTPLTLDDVFERYRNTTRYLIDLKCPDGVVEHRAWDAVVRHGLEDAVEIQAFCRIGLRRARRVDAAVPLSQLYPPLTTSAAIRRDLSRVVRFAHAIGPDAASVDVALTQAAHQHGIRVQPYTVNERDEMARLLALGVDGLITDFPDRALLSIASQLPLAAAA